MPKILSVLAITAMLGLSACAAPTPAQHCCAMEGCCAEGKMNCCDDHKGCCCEKGEARKGCPYKLKK